MIWYQPLLFWFSDIINLRSVLTGPHGSPWISFLIKTGPITVNIVLLARNKRTILIQHPILSHFQAIKKVQTWSNFQNFRIFEDFAGNCNFFTVGIFSVPFRNDPIVLIWDNFMVFLPQAFYNLWKMFHQFIFRSPADNRRLQTEDRLGHFFVRGRISDMVQERSTNP